jgi:hypothetical protein
MRTSSATEDLHKVDLHKVDLTEINYQFETYFLFVSSCFCLGSLLFKHPQA